MKELAAISAAVTVIVTGPGPAHSMDGAPASHDLRAHNAQEVSKLQLHWSACYVEHAEISSLIYGLQHVDFVTCCTSTFKFLPLR